MSIGSDFPLLRLGDSSSPMYVSIAVKTRVPHSYTVAIVSYTSNMHQDDFCNSAGLYSGDIDHTKDPPKGAPCDASQLSGFAHDWPLHVGLLGTCLQNSSTTAIDLGATSR